jgi:hypothetical protein
MTFIPRDSEDLSAIMAEVDMCEDRGRLEGMVRFLDKDKYGELYEHVQRRLYELPIEVPFTVFPILGFQQPVFEKTELELQAYKVPLTKIIEDNSMKDLREIEDEQWQVAVAEGLGLASKLTRS